MAPVSPLLAANLHRLACPVCHGGLRLVDEVIECAACSRRYPIVDGLPVLIGPRATRPPIPS